MEPALGPSAVSTSSANLSAEVSSPLAYDSSLAANTCASSTPITSPAIAPRRRRWGRFSLRTLLIAVTLASFAMALFSSRFERTRRTVDAIKAAGGEVCYTGPPRQPGRIESWLRARLPQSYFDEVRCVYLRPSDEETAAASLPHVARLTSLRQLGLTDLPVSDAGLAHLSGLRSLQGLYLAHTRVSDSGLAHLAGLTSLELLDLEDTQISDAGLAHLFGLTSLGELYLSGTQVTDAGVQELQRSLPNCRIGH